jgi:hypothetical protein
MPPIRPFQITPPLAEISQIDRMIWRRKDQRAGIEHMRQRAGILFWIGRNLGKGDMPGGADEFLELPVGHRRAVDPEAIDPSAILTRIKYVDLQKCYPVKLGEALPVALRPATSQDRCQDGMQGLEELRWAKAQQNSRFLASGPT